MGPGQVFRGGHMFRCYGPGRNSEANDDDDDSDDNELGSAWIEDISSATASISSFVHLSDSMTKLFEKRQHFRNLTYRLRFQRQHSHYAFN